MIKGIVLSGLVLSVLKSVQVFTIIWHKVRGATDCELK